MVYKVVIFFLGLVGSVYLSLAFFNDDQLLISTAQGYILLAILIIIVMKELKND